MSGRTTAEIVAEMRGWGRTGLAAVDAVTHEAADRLVELDDASRMGWSVATKLGDELHALNALCLPCPTCGGTGTLGERDYFADKADPCPDCTDGRMSWEWMARIVAAVFDAKGSMLYTKTLRGIR